MTPPVSVAHRLAHHAKATPDADVLIFRGPGDAEDAITFARLHADAAACARTLRDRGVAEGDLVIIAGDHDYDTARAFYGALYHGAIPSIFPYNDAATLRLPWLEQLERRMAQTQCRAILSPSSLAEQIRDASSEAGFAVMELPPRETGDSAPDGVSISERSDEDIAYVQFSSGTTGDPHGAVLSHRALIDNMNHLRESLAYTASDVFINWAPFFHDLGLVCGLIKPVLIGARGVLLKPSSWVRRPSLLLRAVDQHRGTVTWMPNFAFRHIARTVKPELIEKFDLSCWRVVGCGGEMVRTGDLEDFARALAPSGFRSQALVAGYGMAEIVVGGTHTPLDAEVHAEWVSARALTESGRAFRCRRDSADAVSVTSCGVPVPGTRVTIQSAQGEPLPARHVGEIVIESRSLFSGYWAPGPVENPIAPPLVYATGDLGYLAEGELYVCDRKQDLIIVGGRNFYPDHIEPVATEVVGNRAGSVAAFGIPNSEFGTEIAVLVCEVRGQLSDFDSDSMTSAIRHRVRSELDLPLADVRIVRRGWIPKTTSGKISRSAARERYESEGWKPRRAVAISRRWRDAAPEDLHEELGLLAVETFGFRPAPDMSLIDQGATSIQIMEFLAIVLDDVEEIPAETFFDSPTLDHLSRMLGSTADVPAPGAEPPDSTSSKPPRWQAVAAEARRLARKTSQLGAAGAGKAAVERLATRLPTLAFQIATRAGADRLFEEELAMVERCRAVVSPEAPAGEVREQSLRTNLFRREALDSDGYERTHRELVLHDRARLDRLLDEESGLILVTTHAARNGGIIRLLRDLELMPRTAFVGRTAVASRLSPAERRDASDAGYLSSVEQTVVTRQIVAARRSLNHGGIVVVAGDGLAGRSGDNHLFHGRNLWFGTGFAELATHTGAAVLPVIESIDAEGTVHVRFYPQLSAPGERLPVSRLLNDYVRTLEKIWSDDLGSIAWSRLRAYLDAPPA